MNNEIFLKNYIFIAVVLIGLVLYCVFFRRNTPVFFLGVGVFVGEILQSVCYILYTISIMDTEGGMSKFSIVISYVDAFWEFVRVALILTIIFIINHNSKKEKGEK